MGRELPPTDDFGVVWFGHGVELARRMQALAEELRYSSPGASSAITDVLLNGYNPLPALPELGMPPSHSGRGVATEPGA